MKSEDVTPETLAVVRPRKVEESFLSYAVREGSFVESVVARSTGVSYPACNASEVGCIPIPLPSPTDQRAIADFLDRETSKIDRLSAKVEEAIGRLQEYRAALITAAVTGKIDVWAAAGMGKRLEYPKPQSELRMVAEGNRNTAGKEIIKT